MFHNFIFFLVIDWGFVQRAQRVEKLAHKTHKDRVNEFNAQLESLSEHHDIPKVLDDVNPLFDLLTSQTRLDQAEVSFRYSLQSLVHSLLESWLIHLFLYCSI